jgi:hypothetical protein
MEAKDLTFIRTQADSFAWQSLAANALADMGVLEPGEAQELRRIARKVIAQARQDPKFIGQQSALKRVEG